MAGRPRIYANAAEKTHAYRERIEKENGGTTKVYTHLFEQSQSDMRRLIGAVLKAQRRGDPLALSLETKRATDLVLDLSQYFETGQVRDRETISDRAKNTVIAEVNKNNADTNTSTALNQGRTTDNK